MPYDYDLNKFKEQAHKDAMVIAMQNTAGNVTANWLAQKIEKALVAAYVAGYKKCEEEKR